MSFFFFIKKNYDCFSEINSPLIMIYEIFNYTNEVASDGVSHTFRCEWSQVTFESTHSHSKSF